jgi:adenosylcobinamide-GDP ribazoletransferase
MNAFLAAVRFLTVFPLPGARGTGERDMVRSVPFFPVIGLLVGGAAAGLAATLDGVFPPTVLAWLLVVWLAGVSGAFHLDGLADAADGLLSSRPRDRILEIMKDSRVGVMGVVVVVLVLGLKAAALASLASDVRWRAVLLMPVAGRCALVFQMALLPAARKEDGVGRLFLGKRSPFEWLWAGAVLAGVSWLTAAGAGLLCSGVSVGLVLLFALFCYRKVGGATGDTLGAGCELTEAACVVAMSAVPMGPLLV